MPALTARATDALAGVCADVRTADEAGRDDVDGVRPGVVARPTDVEQVAEVLRATAAHGLAVVPRGAGTKLSWGVAPRAADVLLDLAGLDEVVDHAAGDLIVVARAGTPLSRVQETVASAGQRLALDETVPGSTIGGVLATNTSGRAALGTGTARDLLIGVTVVRADGVVAKAGGRVVKNVAGYDLGKLVIGSLGTLAVVVDATFRLHPLPPAEAWVHAPAPDVETAVALARAVVHAQVVPAAVEVTWQGGSGSVAVLLEGREEGVAARVDAVRALLGPGAERGDDPGAGYPWDTAARDDDRVVALKVTFSLSGLGDVLRAADAAGATLRGSAGAGVVHLALPAGTSAEAAATALAGLRAAATAHGGSAVVVDAPAEVKAALDVWGPVPALDLMRRTKAQLDPGGHLSPGRFVGGI